MFIGACWSKQVGERLRGGVEWGWCDLGFFMVSKWVGVVVVVVGTSVCKRDIVRNSEVWRYILLA